jgi:hypothetical protein
MTEGINMATERTEKWQGMNWIRKEKRLAIYLRDGLGCSYCGQGLEDEIKLTLDHLIPHSHGGKNDAKNLVTCCQHCNSSRGNRDWQRFAFSVAEYVDHGVSAEEIIRHIESTIAKPLNIVEAKNMMARRGGFSQALRS